jgi:hypothetical protein
MNTLSFPTQREVTAGAAFPPRSRRGLMIAEIGMDCSLRRARLRCGSFGPLEQAIDFSSLGRGAVQDEREPPTGDGDVQVGRVRVSSSTTVAVRHRDASMPSGVDAPAPTWQQTVHTARRKSVRTGRNALLSPCVRRIDPRRNFPLAPERSGAAKASASCSQSFHA